MQSTNPGIDPSSTYQSTQVYTRTRTRTRTRTHSLMCEEVVQLKVRPHTRLGTISVAGLR